MPLTRIDSFIILQYHIHVAVKKNNQGHDHKAQSGGAQAIVVFWLVFIIIIISIFLANAGTIKKNFDTFKTRLTSSPGSEQISLSEDEEITELTVQVPEPDAAEPPAVMAPAPEQSAPQITQQPQTQTPPASMPAQTRDRPVYFTQIDRDGQILQSRVVRRISVSDSPMQDALNVLLMGPTAEELNRGIINLIPQNTRMLSAPTIRGTTAYINFSEDFLFNTFGIEGYVAQLRQIIWTVTEFSTVSDVQILIEGRRMDYLGEGIWIGSPISRQSF